MVYFDILPGSSGYDIDVYVNQNFNIYLNNSVRGDTMSVELVHIGFNNILAMNRVIAIASPNSAPTKRTIHEGRNNGKLVDMTSGRRTKAVIFTDSGHILLAALAPETIMSRAQAGRASVPVKMGQSDSEYE